MFAKIDAGSINGIDRIVTRPLLLAGLLGLIVLSGFSSRVLAQWDPDHGGGLAQVVAASVAPAEGAMRSDVSSFAGTEFRARKFSSAWYDKKGRLWIFGGYGEDADGQVGLLNDLWMWDGQAWRLLSGSMLSEKSGVYRAQSEKTAALTPGARMHPETWRDEGGTLWLYGGFGRDAAGSVGPLKDLWKWDGTRWSWVSGPERVSQSRGAPDADTDCASPQGRRPVAGS